MTFKRNIYHLLAILMKPVPVPLRALTCWHFSLQRRKEREPSIFGPEITSEKQKGGWEEAISRV